LGSFYWSPPSFIHSFTKISFLVNTKKKNLIFSWSPSVSLSPILIFFLIGHQKPLSLQEMWKKLFFYLVLTTYIELYLFLVFLTQHCSILPWTCKTIRYHFLTLIMYSSLIKKLVYFWVEKKSWYIYIGFGSSQSVFISISLNHKSWLDNYSNG
jgi:hypothetical protein